MYELVYTLEGLEGSSSSVNITNITDQLFLDRAACVRSSRSAD